MAHPRRNVVGWDGASVDARCRPRSPRRHPAFRPGHIFECCRRRQDIRTGSRPRRGSGIDLIGDRSPLPRNTVIFGEVGLAAEVRRVSHPEQRLKEAAKLGFEQVIMPPIKAKGLDLSGMGVHAVDSLNALIESLGGRG